MPAVLNFHPHPCSQLPQFSLPSCRSPNPQEGSRAPSQAPDVSPSALQQGSVTTSTATGAQAAWEGAELPIPEGIQAELTRTHPRDPQDWNGFGWLGCSCRFSPTPQAAGSALCPEPGARWGAPAGQTRTVSLGATANLIAESLELSQHKV